MKAPCPRCQAPLHPAADPEAAATCLHCGDIYIPVTSIEQARQDRSEEDAPNGPRIRRRTATRVAPADRIIADGCFVSPTCLACPLPECYYVTNATEHRGNSHRTVELHAAVRQAYASTYSVTATAEQFQLARRTIYRILQEGQPMNPEPERAPEPTPLRTLSTRQLADQCITSLRFLDTEHAKAQARLAGIREEAAKLGKVLRAVDHDVPAELAYLVGKPPKATTAAAPPSTRGSWVCPECSFVTKGRGITQHKEQTGHAA